MDSTLTIDGIGPMPLRRPDTVAELAELVREAAARQQGLYPVGGGTMLDLGLPPAKLGFAVDTRGLDQVIDYPARDMTITVQAGITIERLQTTLRAEGQWLPVDVPLPERATLGGAVAANASGPRRYGYGTLRDYVIGIGVVNDEGEEVKGGGRVVKNVAGYDLMKLFTGSFGTLGVISQVTLKVLPLPEASRLLFFRCAGASLAPAWEAIRSSRTRPVCFDINGRPTDEGDWILAVGYEGNAAAVAWQADQLQRELPNAIAQPVPATEEWTSLRDSTAVTGRFAFRANLNPSETVAFLQHAAGPSPKPPALHAHAGNGIVHGRIDADVSLDDARKMLTALAEVGASAQGNLIVTRCPSEWKTHLPIWGRPRGDLALMRAVKQRLDPRGIFNPGRFVGGI